MKTVRMTEEQVNALAPDDIVVTIWVGSDDILTQNLEEVMKGYKDDGIIPDTPITNCQLLDVMLADVSGNGQEIMTIQDGKIVKLDIV